MKKAFIALWLILLLLWRGTSVFSQPLRDAGKNQKGMLTLAAWFTAQEVDKYLTRAPGLDSAVSWCKKYGVTKVHLEAFGRGLYARRETLIAAKNRFLKEGIEVASGVTTTKFGKNGADEFGTGWSGAQCYTNEATQQELQRIVEYTASIFDEIIFDDWYFTQCECDECIKARGDLSWAAYYTGLMDKLSEQRVMKPAHAVNPKVKVIIKFPQWYDEFNIRGYDVVRESKIFDGIWVGTEDRNFDYENGPGYEIGYNAYFNMRWLATLGSAGGGWFDTGGPRTKVTTYLEQARHTVLGEGKTMILWSYSGHLAAPQKMDALHQELPGLEKLARLVQGRPIKGVHLLKPGNSDPFEEEWICSFLGNLGIPLVPASEANEEARSAIFPVQALKDTHFIRNFQRIVNRGTPILLTDGLAKRINSNPAYLNNANVMILPLQGSPKKVLLLSREQLRPIRDKLLAPYEIRFDAPNKVELYLFGDDLFVVENVNETAVDVTLDLPHLSDATKALVLPENEGKAELSRTGNSIKIHLSPNTLVAVDYK